MPEAQIEFVDDGLDDCGPIPFLEAKMRQPDEPDAVDSTTTSTSFAVRDVAHVDKRWLYLSQIGEDYADCLGSPSGGSASLRQYSFGRYVVMQCAVRSVNTADDGQ